MLLKTFIRGQNWGLISDFFFFFFLYELVYIRTIAQRIFLFSVFLEGVYRYKEIKQKWGKYMV